MGRLRRRWAPDKRGLLQAVAGLIAAVINTALPIGAVFDVIMALGNFKDSDLDLWHHRLIDGINRWAADHPELVAPVGGLRTGWDQDFLADLDKIGAPALLGSDQRTREVVEDALARSAFTPLIASDENWAASRAAARQLADALPGLLVAATGPQSGMAALLQTLRSDLGVILDRLPPGPAGRAVCEAYVNVLIDELDHDPWTRMAGGQESSLTSIAGRLRVTARPDTGYRPAALEETGDARDLASRCERIVLLGGPGAGKSWLARRIAIDAAEQAGQELAAGAPPAAAGAAPASGADQAPAAGTDPATVEIPLFAPCAEVFANGLPAWEAVVTTALAQVAHRFGSDRLHDAIKRRFMEQPGRFVVVLDGLDEADHLPYGEILDRLARTADRQLRIVLTSRPDSWRRQLPLDEHNDRHRIADILPMAYPGDVVAVVNSWLGGQPAARDRLLARLDDNPELAQAAETPLLCAMYCLLAESGDESAVAGAALTERVVTRLLEGTWRGQHLDAQQRSAARTALRRLAWAGAAADPVTGLSAWPETIRHTFDPLLPDLVEDAVSHVAPTGPYDLDRIDAPRKFLHHSIREHLVAEYVAALPTVAQALAAIEPHLWYDQQWRQLLPWAVASHPDRDGLLDAVIGARPGTDDLALALRSRDGFGELRDLLTGLAAETSPDDWSPAHATLIDKVCRSERAAGDPYGGKWLPVAARGWPAARPDASALAGLRQGVVSRQGPEIRAWVGLLELTGAARQQAVADLVGVLCGSHPVGLGDEPAVARMLDALGPPPGLRAAAIDCLIKRLGSSASAAKARALRVLTGEPVADSLLHTIVDQLPAERSGLLGGSLSDHDLNRKATALDVLGAGEAIRRQALARILGYLAAVPAGETTLDEITGAIACLRPVAAERARAIDLLLTCLLGQDSYHRRRVMEKITALLPPPAQAGAVLLELVGGGGPWSAHQAGQILGRLAAGATEQERSAAVAAVRDQLATSGPGPEIRTWAEHLNALMPTAAEREAAAGLLVTRLADIPGNICGYPMQAARELRPTSQQRAVLIGYLCRHVDHEESADLKVSLCRMALWFTPAGEARSTVAAALLDASRSMALDSANLAAFTEAFGALPFTDEERTTLIDRLLERMPAEGFYRRMDLAKLVTEAGPVGEQRASVADLLVTWLDEAVSTGMLHGLVEALQRLDAPTDWRVPVRDAVVAELTQAGSNEPYDLFWAELLPGLGLPDSERHQLADTLIQHLKSDIVTLGSVLALLDMLRPDPGQETAITDRLIATVTETAGFTAAKTIRAVLARPLTAQQRDAMAVALLACVTQTRPRDLASLLDVAAAAPLSSGERDSVTAQAVAILEAGGSGGPLSEARNIPETMQALVSIGGMSDDTKERALRLALAEVARTGTVGAPLDAVLPRLGFGAAALKDFAHDHRDQQNAGRMLRELASVLRHHNDPAAWVSALEQLAGDQS